MFSKEFWNHYQTDFQLISWLFLRGLALIYFSAFASMLVQIVALVGSNGILPITDQLLLIEQFYPQQKLWLFPSIFWFNATDTMLNWSCYLGMAAATLLLCNILTRSSLIICFILYLSLVQAGQEFTYFQWDVLLLETGILAIFLSWRSGIIILLFRFLIARFMLMGGVVKIASGDQTWANFTALNYYYETQPIPSPLAFYVHQLPQWFHKMSVGSVLLIELIIPFFVFLPGRFRHFACFAFIFLQGAIILTGNYTFFNLLTILLCLFLLHDSDIKKIVPQQMIKSIKKPDVVVGKIANFSASFYASFVLLICILQLGSNVIQIPSNSPLSFLLRISSAFSLVNNYGPFAVMTTQRKEIIIQGSNDAMHWSDYQFKYKPGKVDRALGWNIPHHPRLDWQMWFAALSPAIEDSWFDKLLIRLLQGSPSVLAMLDNNPFPNQAPKYIRAISYQYSYSSYRQFKRYGNYWNRQDKEIYWPARSFWNKNNQK